MRNRVAVLAVSLGIASWGCGTAPSERARSADGVSIAYDVRGSGETTLLFVHGWACDRSFWREQVDVFAEDYRVVSLDLGGHGESGIGRERWTPRELGEDVRAVAEALELERFVLVAHSMGGAVSLEAARLMPDEVSGILCVDSLHNVELKPPDFTISQLTEGLRSDFNGAMAAIVESGFDDDADPELVAFVRERAQRMDPEVAIALIEGVVSFDVREALSAVSVPVRCINSAYGLATTVETNRQYGDFDAVTLDAGGHFQHMESPERFNAEMKKLLDELR